MSTTARPRPRPRGPLPATLPAFAAAHTYQDIVLSDHAQFKPILSRYTEDEQKVLKRFRQTYRKRVRRWSARAPIFPTTTHYHFPFLRRTPDNVMRRGGLIWPI